MEIGNLDSQIGMKDFSMNSMTMTHNATHTHTHTHTHNAHKCTTLHIGIMASIRMDLSFLKKRMDLSWID